MPEVFSFVPVFPTSGAGTLVLGFYVKGFFQILLKFLVLVVPSFGQISPKACHRSSQ